MLDDPYITNPSNMQLAKNILNFLTKDCANGGCKGRCNLAQSKCYKDYCFCNQGFADDNCSTGTHNFNYNVPAD